MIKALIPLLLAATVVVGTSLAASLPFFPATPAVISVANGRQTFQKRCAACHRVEADDHAAYGPSLHNIGDVAASRSVGQTAVEYLWESIVDPGAKKSPGASGEMPRSSAAGLSRQELRNLVAFLISQGGSVSYRQLFDLPDVAIGEPQDTAETPVVSVAVLERGRDIYLHDLKCAQCHSLDTSIGSDWLAPNLRRIGVHGKDHLRESILRPSARIAPSYEQWQLLSDGTAESGRRFGDEKDVCRLVRPNSSTGVSVLEYRPDQLDVLEDGTVMRKLSVSAMPSYAGNISEADLQALLSFLATLR